MAEVKLDSVLTNDDKIILEKPISLEECKIAVLAMGKDRTPGCDGLPAEFYSEFWDVIGQTVFNSINEGLETCKLSESQNLAILRLLYKKGEHSCLDNWRPISLLNTDYKILASVMARRLQPILGRIINKDQTAYIKNRFIGENVRLIYDVISYTDMENIPGAISFLDFCEAFDSVEWNFSFKVMRKFEFGRL